MVETFLYMAYSFRSDCTIFVSGYSPILLCLDDVQYVKILHFMFFREYM